MSSEGQDATLKEAQEDTSTNADQASTATQKVAAKRRTKSGCLRSAESNVEKNVQNCIKSKRECTGYNQPFVYKQQPGIPPPNISGHVFPSDLAPHGLSFDDLGRPWTVYPQPTSTYATHGVGFTFQTPSSTATPASHIETHHSGVRSNHVQPNIQGQWSGQVYQQPISWQPEQQHQQFFQDGRRTSETIPGTSTGAQTTTLVPANMDALTGDARAPYPPQYDSHSNDLSRHVALETVNITPLQSAGDSLRFSTAVDRDDPDDPWDVEFDMTAYDTATNVTVVPTPVSATTPEIPQSVSQLMDEEGQRIFAHFVNVTGPCMSIFDKYGDIDPNGLPRMVWTYSLPSLALRRPALAHAILALGALHMANLQQGDNSIAVKHFTHALQRVGKLLAQTDRRHEVSTLATVLVLGYYEVLIGDHSKWSLHLSGAGKLVMEHNYSAMIRTVRRMRMRAHDNISQAAIPAEQLSRHQYIHLANVPESLLNDRDWNVDEAWVGRLMGMRVDYEHQAQPKFENKSVLDDLTETEVGNWRLLMDMYWWYCKQDIFQSMISGDPLQLTYKLWKYCPPRGPFGDLNAAYATVDYLWLIMARLTDFGGKDRIRKQRAVSAQGGQWVPAPGFFGPSNSSSSTTKPSVATPAGARKTEPPSANEGRIRKARHIPASSPVSGQSPMYGMIPPREGPIQMSSSFRAMNAELHSGVETTPEENESPDPSSATLEAATNQALAEHAAIVTAFDDFASALGPDFEPLTSDPEATISTPFGPAIRYHSPTIALMWTFYHVGRILLRRLHPHSPPAAMVSAGVNAAFTHEHAQMVGRICGALYAQNDYLLQSGVRDYCLAAGLTETTFSLLFAGVQYRDSDQRSWTVAKLNQIEQVTGWQTSTTVAAACETTWERVGLAGRGPPYTRTLDYTNSDSRINGMGRSMPPVPVTASGKVDPLKEHESRFVNNDRNLIDRHGSTRTHWAIGILSVEEDLRQMSIGKHQSKDDEASSGTE